MAFPSFPRKKVYEYRPPSDREMLWLSVYEYYMSNIRRWLSPGKLLIYVFVLAMAVAAFAGIYCIPRGGVSLKAAVEPGVANIGDRITYTLVLDADRAAVYEKPDLEAVFEDVTVLDTSSSERSLCRREKVTWEVIFTDHYPGYRYIPPVEIRVEGPRGGVFRTVSSSEQEVYFRKLVKGDLDGLQRGVTMGGGMAGEAAVSPAAGLPGMSGGLAGGGGAVRGRTVRGPIRYPVKGTGPPRDIITGKDVALRALLWVAGGIAALFAVFFLLVAIIQGRRGPSITPEELTIRRLKRLRDKGLYARGRTREFCKALRWCVARYICAASGVETQGKTGKELAELLRNAGGIDDNERSFLEKRISVCEHVMYSGYSPSEGELDPELEEEINMFREIMRKKEGTVQEDVSGGGT